MTTTGQEWTPRENPSEDYERYLVPTYFRPFAEELARLVAPWPGNRVLDVACGTGALTRLLVDAVGPTGHVTGLDLSPAMLSVARELLDVPTVAWREGSVQSLPFADGSFDVVACHQGLQFFPDREEALREMRRVLRPGGRLALSVWRPTAHNPVFALLAEALARVVGREAAVLPPFAFDDAEELRRLARTVGFTDVAVRIDGRMVRFPSPGELVRRLRLGGPTMLRALDAADADAPRRLAQEVTHTMSPYVDDAGLAAPMATHILLAR